MLVQMKTWMLMKNCDPTGDVAKIFSSYCIILCIVSTYSCEYTVILCVCVCGNSQSHLKLFQPLLLQFSCFEE